MFLTTAVLPVYLLPPPLSRILFLGVNISISLRNMRQQEEVAPQGKTDETFKRTRRLQGT